MKELKISVPAGYEIDQEKSTFENIVFKEIIKNIREMIQTMKDVYDLNNIAESEFLKNCKNDSSDEVGFKKVKLIVSAYNQGKTPDFNDNISKYLPYFDMRESSFRYDNFNFWCAFSVSSSRLLFLGSEAKANMFDAVEKFLPEYKQYLIG